MFATLYNVAVDLPLQESAWWAAFLWLCRCLYLFSYIRCYCCGGGECAGCDDGDGPEEFQVVLSGITDVGCFGSCPTDWNQTFVLERHETYDLLAECCWGTDLFALKCSGFGNMSNIIAYIASDGTFTVQAFFSDGDNACFDQTSNAGFSYSTSFTFGEIPCSTFASESIPVATPDTFGCDTTASTCLVTAL